MTTKTTKTTPTTQSTRFEFTQAGLAWAFADRAEVPCRVLLGDATDGRVAYWVVSPADATRLARAGYEYACR